MKKIGLFSLVLIFALGGLGIGYAHWTDTLYIGGDINNGWVDVNFHSQYDNDINGNDPKVEGNWVIPSGGGAPWWNGTRYNKNVASTTSTWTQWGGSWPSDTGNSAEITIVNGYPSYWGSVMWDIQNNGSVPVELWTVTLTELSKGLLDKWVVSVALDIGTRYYVNVETLNVDQSLDDGDDFSFILSAYNTTQLDPYTEGWGLPKGYLDITVHIEQDAEQKADYDFIIEYVFANWNEVP